VLVLLIGHGTQQRTDSVKANVFASSAEHQQFRTVQTTNSVDDMFTISLTIFGRVLSTLLCRLQRRQSIILSEYDCVLIVKHSDNVDVTYTAWNSH